MEPGLDGDAHLIGIGFDFFALDRKARNPNLEHVVGVEREVVADRHPRARVERQLVVQLLVPGPVHRIALRIVNFLNRFEREIADREPADLPRGRHVPIEQRGRRREHRRDVVEAVPGVVDRQPFARADVDGEQIANRVAVLRAIQTMDGRAARIGMRDCRGVERRFEIRLQRADGPRVGTDANGRRRHFAGSQLAQHFFPHVGMRGRVREVHRLERQPAGLQPVVMARHAGGGDEARVLRRRRRVLRSARRAGECEGRRHK